MSGIIVQENVPLAPFTTMGVGGPARYFVSVTTAEDALRAVRLARENSREVFILGGGSNIVVADDGFPGVVIHNQIRGFANARSGDKMLVRVGAGEIWDDFVKRAIEAGWAGLENLSGVPGSVGAVPVQNVGCYGQSAANFIKLVRAIDIQSGEIKTFTRSDCGFGYRDSIFRSGAQGKYFITEVELELTPGGEAKIVSYPDIERYFDGQQTAPTLLEMRRAILEIRARKGMVIMPGHESYMSVGSFFKNPVISARDFDSVRGLVERFSQENTGRWFWEEEGGAVKLAAARLVELGGFPKGFRDGKVGISPKHALAIINLGGARAHDVITFALEIQSTVREKFNVELELEAQIVGTQNIF